MQYFNLDMYDQAPDRMQLILFAWLGIELTLSWHIGQAGTCVVRTRTFD